MALSERRQRAESGSKFDRWLGTLSDQNHKTVMSWLTDPGLSHAEVGSWLRDDDPDDGFRGYPADGTTVATWRRANGVDR